MRALIVLTFQDLGLRSQGLTPEAPELIRSVACPVHVNWNRGKCPGLPKYTTSLHPVSHVMWDNLYLPPLLPPPPLSLFLIIRSSTILGSGYPHASCESQNWRGKDWVDFVSPLTPISIFLFILSLALANSCIWTFGTDMSQEATRQVLAILLGNHFAESHPCQGALVYKTWANLKK